MKPGMVNAVAAGAAETLGGAGLLLGYRTPLASAGLDLSDADRDQPRPSQERPVGAQGRLRVQRRARRGCGLARRVRPGQPFARRTPRQGAAPARSGDCSRCCSAPWVPVAPGLLLNRARPQSRHPRRRLHRPHRSTAPIPQPRWRRLRRSSTRLRQTSRLTRSTRPSPATPAARPDRPRPAGSGSDSTDAAIRALRPAPGPLRRGASIDAPVAAV